MIYSNWKIISKWLFFIPTNARHPVSIVLGQKAVNRFQKKMSGEYRSLDKKRPQYLLSTTNVAQPKKGNYKNSSKLRFIVLLSTLGKQPTVRASVATKCLSPFLVLGLSSTLCPLTLFALNSACRLFTYWSAAGLVARDGRRSSTGPSASIIALALKLVLALALELVVALVLELVLALALALEVALALALKN